MYTDFDLESSRKRAVLPPRVLENILVNCSCNSRCVSSISISDFYIILKRRSYGEGYQNGLSHGRIRELMEGRVGQAREIRPPWVLQRRA
jgi:hypothetical protein